MTAVLDGLLTDEAWIDRPLWVLYLQQETDSPTAGEEDLRGHQLLLSAGATIVYDASSAVTVVGRHEYSSCIVVEYASPAAFAGLLLESGVAGLAEMLGPHGYAIPTSSGWLPSAASGFPAPLKAQQPIARWDAARLEAHVDENEKIAAAGRSGPTFATMEQAKHFATEPAQGGGEVWMLNLVQFSAEPRAWTGRITPDRMESGEAAYARYGELTAASAEDDGPLIQHAGRAMYSSRRISASLVGESDFDRMMLVQYPDRDHYLSMGAYKSYVAAHPYREQGLAELYIVSTRPKAPSTSAAARL
jgi:hypothetical protein